jgi:hypothetical protein
MPDKKLFLIAAIAYKYCADSASAAPAIRFDDMPLMIVLWEAALDYETWLKADKACTRRMS